MAHFLVASLASFDCFYLNIAKNTARNDHRMSASKKKGVMSLHRTVSEIIISRKDKDRDLLILEDDVYIKFLNRSYVEQISTEFPEDHVIRFDCQSFPGMKDAADKCNAKRVVRHCWCGVARNVVVRDDPHRAVDRLA